MRKDIKGFVKECEKCIKARHTRYYPSKPSTLPTGLLQTVRADLFKFVAELINKTAKSKK